MKKNLNNSLKSFIKGVFSRRLKPEKVELPSSIPPKDGGYMLYQPPDPSIAKREIKIFSDIDLAEKHLLAEMDRREELQAIDFGRVPEVTMQVTEPTEPIPPWIKYPSIPCYSLGWRMGRGESYMQKWSSWMDDKEINFRVAYFKKYMPLPNFWLVWIAHSCGHPINFREFSSEETIYKAVLSLEELGLADFNEFKLWAAAQKIAWLDAKNN